MKPPLSPGLGILMCLFAACAVLCDYLVIVAGVSPLRRRQGAFRSPFGNLRCTSLFIELYRKFFSSCTFLSTFIPHKRAAHKSSPTCAPRFSILLTFP